MDVFTQGQIAEHCFFVKTGKPCSVLLIKTKDIEFGLRLVKKNNLYCFIEKTEDKDWCDLWIFARKELKEIIHKMPQNPKTPFDHFILGCLFGYSIEAICNFIKNGRFTT